MLARTLLHKAGGRFLTRTVVLELLTTVAVVPHKWPRTVLTAEFPPKKVIH